MSDYRINSLIIKDYKRIKAAELVNLAKKSGLLIIGGPNTGGKTSLQDAACDAVEGRTVEGTVEPVRRGAKRAEVRVGIQGDDGGQLVVAFTARKKKGGGVARKVTLTEVRPDGTAKTLAKPRDLLRALLSPIAVKPKSFVDLGQTAAGRREQGKLALQAAGVDVADCDDAIAKHIEEAKVARVRLTDAEARLAGLPEVSADTPDEAVDVAALADEWSRIQAHNAAVAQGRARESDVAVLRDNARDEAERLKQASEAALVKASELNAELGELEDARKAPEDPNAVKEQIAQADTINAAVRAKAGRIKALEAIEATQVQVDAATTARDVRRQEKIERLAGADFGDPDVAITDEGEMTYKGVQLAQASQAEQLFVCGHMACHTSKLGDVFFRDASLIDEHWLPKFAQLAIEHKARFWMEVAHVGEDAEDDVRLIIEDGGSIAVQADKGETSEPEPETAAPEAAEEAEAPEPAPEPAPAPADAEWLDENGEKVHPVPDEVVEGAPTVSGRLVRDAEGEDIPDDLSFLEE